MNDGARRTGGLDPAVTGPAAAVPLGGRTVRRLYGFPRSERADGEPDGGSAMGRLRSRPQLPAHGSAGPPATGSHVLGSILAHIGWARGLSASRTLKTAAIERAV